MSPGDRVVIEADEFPELVGMEVTVEKMGPDGTTAWVSREGMEGIAGVWCSVSNLRPL